MSATTDLEPTQMPAAEVPWNAPLLERRHYVLGALLIVLAAATCAAHWRALSARAIYFDDVSYYFENPVVRNPSWESLGIVFGEVTQPSVVKGYYQPVTLASFMIDAALADSSDVMRQIHWTNLFLHVLNTLLIALLFFLLFDQIVPAVLAALLFGVHPLTVESIAWLSERKTLLATCFALTSLVLYVQFVRRGLGGWLIASGVAFVLALLSKPTTTPLPLVMILIDWWPLRRLNRQAIIEKMPFFVLAAASGIITIISQGHAAGTGLQGEHPVPTTLLIICHNIVFYLRKVIWPEGLSPHYPFPSPFDFSNGALLAGVVGTILLLPLLAMSLKWTRALVVGWLVFFIALLPTLVLGFNFGIAADKYTYLPLLGVGLIACWLFTEFWQAAAGSVGRRAALVSAVIVCAVAEGAHARDYLLMWRDGMTLRRHALKLAPQSGIAYDMVASDLAQQGKTDEALAMQLKAVELDPNVPTVHHNLGTTLMRTGKTDEAVDHFRKAIELKPDYAPAHAMLGNALLAQGKAEDAVRSLETAVELDPGFAEAHFNLATVYAQRSNLNKTLEHFYYAIKSRPNFPMAHHNRGVFFMSLADQRKDPAALEQAVLDFLAAIRQSPNYLSAHVNLAHALDRLGRRDEAIYEYQEVLRLDPKDEQAQKAVAVLTNRYGAVARKPM